MNRQFVFLMGMFSATASTDSASRIVVRVLGLHTAHGAVVCRLYASADGFPAKPVSEDATVPAYMKPMVAPIVIDADKHTPIGTCPFVGVPDGTYAIAVFHDENGNGKLDKNFIGIPAEGVGVSNNRFPFIGPPSWKDAKFVLNKDTSLDVTLRY